MSSQRMLAVERPGLVAYPEGLELQQSLVSRRRLGQIPDTLVLLEHPHVITMGSGARTENVVASSADRARLGIGLYEAGRGGDVTYHGPGQLVAYPILDLNPDRKDLHRYLRDLESTVIGAARYLGVEARARKGLTGVWTELGKLASVGVRVSSGWITSHGLALNVSTDMSYFDTIVPCGIREARPTSLTRELGRRVEMARVQEALVRAFCGVFDRVPCPPRPRAIPV